MGASVLFLVEYVPVAPGTEGLVLDSSQRERLNDAGLTEGLPYPIVRLPGDEEAYGGCLAAGRGFIHIAPEGRLEACPFAPFSDSNAGEVGLKAALASPLMRAIRERHHELTETKGGCALRDKAGWIAGICGSHESPATVEAASPRKAAQIPA
jgi:MoaA/NifB/PqqE/SkfB family radical SAM enzyme